MIHFYQFHYTLTKQGELLIKIDHSRPCIDKEMAASLLEQRAAENSLSLPLTAASTMFNSPQHPSRSDTENDRRYSNSNSQVLLNPEGKPVAFRRVRVLKPGTFAGASRLQLVTPRKTASISRTCFEAYRSKCHALN